MIECAVQKGNLVYVYGNGNHLLFTKPGELYGYTSTTVSIKNAGLIYIYNDKGNHIGCR